LEWYGSWVVESATYPDVGQICDIASGVGNHSVRMGLWSNVPNKVWLNIWDKDIQKYSGQLEVVLTIDRIPPIRLVGATSPSTAGGTDIKVVWTPSDMLQSTGKP
jgi:hypothetical protein